MCATGVRADLHDKHIYEIYFWFHIWFDEHANHNTRSDWSLRKRCVRSFYVHCLVSSFVLYSKIAQILLKQTIVRATYIHMLTIHKLSMFTAPQQTHRPCMKYLNCARNLFDLSTEKARIIFNNIWKSVFHLMPKIMASTNKWTNRKYLSACLTNIIWIGTTVRAQLDTESKH